MTQQATLNELESIKDRLVADINQLAARYEELANRITALSKRVRRIEEDYYKDFEQINEQVD